MRKLLALDQASVTSGWSVFENEKLIKYGHFTFDNSISIGKRLVLIKNKIAELVKEYEINEIAFEDIQMQNTVGNNVVTFKTLAEVYGIIQEYCEENEISYTIVPSSTWKSALGIKGRARAEQKRNAQNYIIEKYNIKPTQDESDSICIGTYMLQKNSDFNWA